MDRQGEAAAANGSAWAAMVAAGVGCASFGALVDLAEASKRVSAVLNLYNPVGDLAGKSAGAVVVWLVAWVVLHLAWRGWQIRRPGRMAAVVVVLILVGIVAAFPPVFGMMARK